MGREAAAPGGSPPRPGEPLVRKGPKGGTGAGRDARSE